MPQAPRSAPPLLALLAVVMGPVMWTAPTARGQEPDQVPAAFRGDWVAAASPCSSRVRFRAAAETVTLINGADRATYGDLAIARTFFGPDYVGISVVLMPEFNSGNSPFTVYFNADEKRGVTKLDIFFAMDARNNPVLQTLQDASRALAARFPLNDTPLRRCPAAN